MQEVASKLNKAERTSIFTIPDVHIDDMSSERDLNRGQVATGRPELAVTSRSVEKPQPRTRISAQRNGNMVG